MDDTNGLRHRRRRWTLPTVGIVALLAVAGLLAAYVGNAFGGRDGGGNGQQLAVGAADNGGVVHAHAGDTLRLELAENPTTGYGWAVELSDGLQAVSDEYTADTVPAGVVGSGGRHVWVIGVTGTGDQTITAAYVRPWSPQEAAERFSVTVAAD